MVAAAGERERAHGAPVECAIERDELFAAGMIAGQLDGGLNRLGAGVAEVNLARDSAGGEGGKLLGEFHHVLVVEVGARHVDQAGGLALDGFDHAGMAVAGGDYGDAGAAVEKPIAVNVLDDGSFAAGDH